MAGAEKSVVIRRDQHNWGEIWECVIRISTQSLWSRGTKIACMLVFELDNVWQSPRWYWLWRYERVVERSWGFALKRSISVHGEGVFSVAAETPAHQRYPYYGMSPRDSTTYEVEPTEAYETSYVDCRTREGELSNPFGAQRIMSPRCLTLSFTLLDFSSDCDCALVLPPWRKKACNFFFFF